MKIMPTNDSGTGHRWSKESNIPVLKKAHKIVEVPKNPKAKDFPQLQRYIETIIKGSNEVLTKTDEFSNVKSSSGGDADARVTSAGSVKSSDRKSKSETGKAKGKTPPVKKGLNPLQKIAIITQKEKESENGSNEEAAKVSPRKATTKPSLPKAATCPTVEIEKFLQKLYPNPYYLENVNEFQNLRLSARTWKCKIENPTTGMKNGKLLDLVFLQVTDQPVTQIRLAASKDETSKETENNKPSSSSSCGILRNQDTSASLVEIYESAFQDCESTTNCLPVMSSDDFLHNKTANSELMFRDANHSESVLKPPSSTSSRASVSRALPERNKCSTTGLFQTPAASRRSERMSHDKFDVKGSEYNLGKLDVLTMDSAESADTIGVPIEKKPSRKRKMPEEKVKINPYDDEFESCTEIVEMGRNIELIEVRSRTQRHRNKMEVKKLYDIVDKTTQSLLEISERNEKETMMKREMERMKRQNPKFENNKFVQFIRKMQLNPENETKSHEANVENVSKVGKKVQKEKKAKKGSRSKVLAEQRLPEICESTISTFHLSRPSSHKMHRTTTNKPPTASNRRKSVENVEVDKKMSQKEMAKANNEINKKIHKGIHNKINQKVLSISKAGEKVEISNESAEVNSDKDNKKCVQIEEIVEKVETSDKISELYISENDNVKNYVDNNYDDDDDLKFNEKEVYMPTEELDAVESSSKTSDFNSIRTYDKIEGPNASESTNTIKEFCRSEVFNEKRMDVKSADLNSDSNGSIDIFNEEIEFVQSGKKIDEMLECVHDFLHKLDEENALALDKCLRDANREKSLLNVEFESLEAESAMDATDDVDGDAINVGNENPAVVAELDYGELERMFEFERQRQRPSFHLISIPENGSGTPVIRQNQSVNALESNRVEIVEETNELGGYNEEKPGEATAGGNVSVTKSLLPLSVRIRKRKNDSSEALKKALEKEEKLFVNHFLDVHQPSSPSDPIFFADPPSESDFLGFEGKHTPWNTRPTAETTLFFRPCRPQFFDSHLFLKPFVPPNSNFVICVNSLSANMRRTYRSNVLFSPPLQSFVETKEKKENEPAPVYTLRSKHILIEPDKLLIASVFNHKYYCLVHYFYGTALGIYSILPVAVKYFVEYPTVETSLNNSEGYIEHIKVPSKESATINESESAISTVVELASMNQLNEISDSAKIETITEDIPINLEITENTFNPSSRNMTALEEAVVKAEESIQELERIIPSKITLKSSSKVMPWCSHSEPFPCCNKSESKVQSLEVEDDMKRVQDLLMRTYNLQRKLHCQLNKMAGFKTSSSRILPKVSLPDLCVLYDAKCDSGTISLMNPAMPDPVMDGGNPPCPQSLMSISVGINSRSMQTEETSLLIQESNKSNVNVIDHGTSCHSTLKGAAEATESEIDVPNCKALENRSSTSSFKSSNDFTEFHDPSAEPKRGPLNAQTPNLIELKNLRFLRKIFSDLELFRESLKAGKHKLFNIEQKVTKKENKDQKFSESEVKEDGIISCINEPAATSKVLKTVFKGKDSTTELAIGLKDVPMSNISVEKKKFSANHTKISISIMKDENNEPKKLIVLPDSNVKVHRNQEGAEYLVDTSSTLQIESFEEEKGSDNEEDDFKSAGSSFSEDSLTASTEDNDFHWDAKNSFKDGSMAEQKKPFRKHRFDFYKKMSLDFNEDATDTLMTRYDVKDVMSRELGPLKKALTDMQIRMRNIKRNSVLNSNDYYDRALKLAKMSAGYCQSCGNRAVIPEDTFGYYKSVLPRRYSTHHLKYCLKNTGETNSSFYSFRSSTELSDRYCDLDLKQSSTYLMNSSRLNNPGLKRSLNNLSFYYEGI